MYDIDELFRTILIIIFGIIILIKIGLQFGWFDWVGPLLLTIWKIIKVIIVIGVGSIIAFILYRTFESKEKRHSRKRVRNLKLKEKELERTKRQKELERKEREERTIIRGALKKTFEKRYNKKIKHLSSAEKNYFLKGKIDNAYESILDNEKTLEDFLGKHVDRKIRLPIKVSLKRAIFRAYHNCPICRKNDLQEIHHIDENPSNNNPKNLIALCATCHRKNLSKDLYRAKWRAPKYIKK